MFVQGKFLLAALLGLLLSGCGYHIGFIRHPQLESLAVAPAINETALYNVASDMRFMMCETLVQDGTYKLSDMQRADAIIYLTVKSADFADVGDASLEDDDTYKPSEWSAKVKVDYRVIIPGRGEPLLAGSVTGSSRFQAPVDLEGGRQRAVRQACYVAAQQVVYAVSEGF